MTDKITIKLVGGEQRVRASQAIHRAPAGYVVTIREPNRTLDQNAKLWAMISDVMNAKPNGREMTADQWKGVFMDACGHQAEFVPSLDGPGFVCLGYKSSHLNKSQFADLIECIYEFGARHEIRWSEPQPIAA